MNARRSSNAARVRSVACKTQCYQMCVCLCVSVSGKSAQLETVTLKLSLLFIIDR